MSTNPKKRGGNRQGAGRKKIVENPVRRNITFNLDTVKKIESMGHDFPDYVRAATDEKLDREKPNDTE